MCIILFMMMNTSISLSLQGLDVLEIMRNIHVFVSKFLYNLNNQVCTATIKQTAFSQGQTDHIHLTLTLTFNSLQAMVITYSQTKFQGQQLGSLKDGVETNSRTDDRADYITFLGNAVSN